MAAKATISIQDSVNTPIGSPAAATRDFTPSGMEGNTHVFTDDHTGVTGATLSTLKASISRGNVVTRVKFALAIPFAHSVDGVEQAAHVCRANFEYLIPVNASQEERMDLYVLAQDILTNAGINNMVTLLEDLY